MDQDPQFSPKVNTKRGLQVQTEGVWDAGKCDKGLWESVMFPLAFYTVLYSEVEDTSASYIPVLILLSSEPVDYVYQFHRRITITDRHWDLDIMSSVTDVWLVVENDWLLNECFQTAEDKNILKVNFQNKKTQIHNITYILANMKRTKVWM